MLPHSFLITTQDMLDGMEHAESIQIQNSSNNMREILNQLSGKPNKDGKIAQYELKKEGTLIIINCLSYRNEGFELGLLSRIISNVYGNAIGIKFVEKESIPNKYIFHLYGWVKTLNAM